MGVSRNFIVRLRWVADVSLILMRMLQAEVEDMASRHAREKAELEAALRRALDKLSHSKQVLPLLLDMLLLLLLLYEYPTFIDLPALH